MTYRRTLLGLMGGAVVGAITLGAAPASAQDVTLRLHHFLSAQANVPMHILDVWADNVEAASDGRIKIDRFPSMQLGGTPGELYDQAASGTADVIWTVVGLTPGRFSQHRGVRVAVHGQRCPRGKAMPIGRCMKNRCRTSFPMLR